ncbi:hypothetical protein AMTRI_Chr05g60200 [Amborella trichopoda]
MTILLWYHGDWSLLTMAHMGPFRVCCLAVWFYLSRFNFGPFLLASLELVFVNYMMILLRPGDAVGGGAIYELVVCLMGSMAYGCWVGSIWYICRQYEVTSVPRTFKDQKHVYHLWSSVEWADRRWKRRDMVMLSVLSLLFIGLDQCGTVLLLLLIGCKCLYDDCEILICIDCSP